MDDHNKMIQQSYSDILKMYGKEQWMEIIKKHLLIEINNERAKAGVNPLQQNIYLNKASQEYVSFLSIHKNKYYNTSSGAILQDTHTQYNADGTKKILMERTMQAWYSSPFVSENISTWPTTIKEVITCWMNSSAHKKTMLSPEYKDIWLWVSSTENIRVANFGKPDIKNRKRTIQSS